MDVLDTIRARHSVRRYLDRRLEGAVLAQLQALVDDTARESGLDIRLVLDNPEAFQVVARFGAIHGAPAYLAFLARGREDDEAIGYWGQRIVLEAQALGLNTCWALMFSRRKARVPQEDGRRLRVVVAVGYGAHAGKPRPSKTAADVATSTCAEPPAWFATAVEAALLAPTAMNRQSFHILLEEDGRTLRITSPDTGPTAIDRGIVKRNVEEAARAAGADFCLA